MIRRSQTVGASPVGDVDYDASRHTSAESQGDEGVGPQEVSLSVRTRSEADWSSNTTPMVEHRWPCADGERSRAAGPQGIPLSVRTPSEADRSSNTTPMVEHRWSCADGERSRAISDMPSLPPSFYVKVDPPAAGRWALYQEVCLLHALMLGLQTYVTSLCVMSLNLMLNAPAWQQAMTSGPVAVSRPLTSASKSRGTKGQIVIRVAYTRTRTAAIQTEAQAQVDHPGHDPRPSRQPWPWPKPKSPTLDMTQAQVDNLKPKSVTQLAWPVFQP